MKTHEMEIYLKSVIAQLERMPKTTGCKKLNVASVVVGQCSSISWPLIENSSDPSVKLCLCGKWISFGDVV